MQDTPEEVTREGQPARAALAGSGGDAKKRRSRRTGKGEPGSRGDSGRDSDVDCRPKMSREITLEMAAKEYIWLWDRRHGISFAALAAREGLSISRVRFGVARARAQERATVIATSIRPPRLVPLFPIGAYTPQSPCGHKRPIKPGSSLCCMVCHTSGMDRHPALRRDPRTDPAPEPKPKPPVAQTKSQRETRKKRRQRLYGARS
jgi:hypothetical protein